MEKTEENKTVDVREALFNDASIGQIQEIQVSESRITSLRGILLDLDLKLMVPDGLLPFDLKATPREFYEISLQECLRRHPLLQKAEVRVSGTGLHVLIQLDPIVEFEHESERIRWSGYVRAAQCLLPTDPDAPGITACTRPIGSVNGKNGAVVEQLSKGSPVTPDEFQQSIDEFRASPFKMTLHILTGQTEVSPCPVCFEKETRLSVLDSGGHCYGCCGQVSLAQLYDTVLISREGRAK